MSLIKNVALVVLSTCFGLALVEVGLRLYYPFSIDVHSSREIANVDLHDGEHYFCQGPHERFRPHDKVMYLERSNGAYFEFRNDGANFFASNQHGFRGKFSPPEGRTARLVLGDSFAWGSLADETESIPALLSRWSR